MALALAGNTPEAVHLSQASILTLALLIALETTTAVAISKAGEFCVEPLVLTLNGFGRRKVAYLCQQIPKHEQPDKNKNQQVIHIFILI
jgi:hypothetical protein